MEVVVLAIIGVTGAWLTVALREHVRWGNPTTRRGSRPVLVAEIPGGADVDLKPIPEMKPGDRVSVIGTVTGRAALVAPLSRRLCMGSDVILCDRMSGEVVGRTLHASVFELTNETGTVLIDGRGAYLRLRPDHVVEGLERTTLDAALRAQVPATVWLDGHEAVILPGATLMVFGEVQPAGPDGAVRADGAARLLIAGGSERAAVVCHLPLDVPMLA